MIQLDDKILNDKLIKGRLKNDEKYEKIKFKLKKN